MKRYLAWAAGASVLAIIAIVAFEELQSRYVHVERGQASLVGSLAIWHVNTKGDSCFVSVDEHPSYSMPRRLEINCSFGPNGNLQYREETNERLLGAIRLLDDAEHLITTWGFRGAYRVKVYRLASDAVTKVLDVGTIAAPGMRYDADGSLMIETDFDGPISSGEKPIKIVHIWHQTTGRFQEQR